MTFKQALATAFITVACEAKYFPIQLEAVAIAAFKRLLAQEHGK